MPSQRRSPIVAMIVLVAAGVLVASTSAGARRHGTPTAQVVSPLAVEPVTAGPATLPAVVDAAPAPPAPDHAAPHGRLQATLFTHGAGGAQPTSSVIADSGRTLYVTNRGDNTVQVFDTSTMTASRTIPEVGYSAWGVLQDGADLLVSNWGGSTVTRIDAATGKKTGTIAVGMKPSYLAASADGTRLYVAGNFSSDVALIDLKKGETIRTLEMGRRPMGVAASADGRFLYVAVCDSKKIAKIDLKQEVVLENFGAALASTTNLVLTRDGSTLLAAGEANRLLVIDTSDGSVGKVKVGRGPSCVALTPDERTALVTGYDDDTVTLVDLAAREPYATVATGRGPIDVQTDGTRFYTCNDKAGSVSAFKLALVEAAPIPAPVATPAQ